MSFMIRSFTVAIFLLVSIGPADPSAAADLRLRFVMDGEAPVPERIDVDRDVECCGRHKLVDESLLVHPRNNGIANVIVYVYTGRRGTKLESLNVPPPDESQVFLSTQHCRFEPRIVVARAGDTLVWKNLDPVGHNVNISFFINDVASFLLPAEQNWQEYDLKEAEPAPIPIACNIHPWMKAHLVVLDHPFVGVSDADGFVEIKGLPADMNLTFRVNHELLSFNASPVAVVECRADPRQSVLTYEEWKRNRFERTLSAGSNRLETILVSGNHLRSNQKLPDDP